MSEDAHDLHLLVESGPILDFCRHFQARHRAATEAAWEFCRSMGSTGFFPPSMGGSIERLIAIDVVPDGWSRLKVRRRASHAAMAPIIGKKGAAARASMEALPKFPSQSEVAKAIGHPRQVRWADEDGEACGACAMGWRFFAPVQLYWPAGNSPLLILCPDAAYYVEEARKENPGFTIIEGEWSVPEGCTVISEAKRDLIVAQAKVAAEEAKAASLVAA